MKKLIILTLILFSSLARSAEVRLICEWIDLNGSGNPSSQKMIDVFFEDEFEKKDSIDVTSIENYKYQIKVSSSESYISLECSNGYYRTKMLQNLVEAPKGTGDLMCQTYSRRTIIIKCVWNSAVALDNSEKSFQVKDPFEKDSVSPMGIPVKSNE